MDQALVAQVQEGDQRAFEALVTADHPRLYRVAFGVLRDRAAAEDATQQALLDIWRDIRRLRDPARYEAWSYRLLVRVCYGEARRRPRWSSSEDLSPDDQGSTTEAYDLVADRDQLERGFRRLSVDHRVVLALRHLLGMTPEQVAEVLGLPRSTVYSRLQAAVKAMRAALEADERSVVRTLRRQEAVR